MERDEILVVAADSEAALRGRARALAAALGEGVGPAGLCAAAAARAHGAHRLAVVGASPAEIRARIEGYLAGAPAEGTSEGRAGGGRRLVFVFGGQGPEHWAMGRELYAGEPVFAEAIHACDEALGRHAPRVIVRQLSAPEAESRLDDVEVIQPALFAIHVGLVRLLRAWGITPDAVVGHSFGELSAVWAAGALSLDDALRVQVVRSRIMKRLDGLGRMAVVEAGVERARAALDGIEDRVAVGVVNSPGKVVLSGEHAALEQALARLAADGVAHRAIPMPYAIHAPAARALMPEVTRALAWIAPRPPSVPLFSTVTGGQVGAVDSAHLARNIGEPVRFADAVGALLGWGASTFVEIGPHPVLGAAIAENAAARGLEPLVLSSLRRRRPERAALLATAGALFAHGHAVAPYPGAPRDDARWERAMAVAVDEAPADPPLAGALRDRARLVAHLAARVGRRLGVDAIDVGTPLYELGLDSAGAVELARTLGEELGRRLPATLFFEHPTVEAAARFLAGEAGPVTGAGARAPARGEAHEPIAIVGVGCRFPGGVDGPDALWRLLEGEVDAVTEVPPARWDAAESFDPDPGATGKTYSKWAGFLDEVDRFDARFFGIAPREAASMDPQQRLLLEVSWEALERAGIRPRSLAGSRTGVFFGVCANDYGGPLLHGDPRDIDAYTFTGNAVSVAAGRVAYVLGLEGPALVVDTACSSSLVALHLACRSLRAGECDRALAGGVNALLSPALFVYFSRLGALSPTGRSRAFDAAADGYVRGEGAGVVVLERLSDARARGDRVLAVLRGSAVNQDGRSNGLTAPSGRAQEAVIRAALADADLPGSRVGYVEAHGTGTSLGDPIELRALGAALGAGRPAERPLLVGSIKTNIGHTEGAAGIAGVIKATLALGHRRIPRSLHFREGNPHVPWSELPVRVAATATAWASDEPRVAGVSSFGFSGTNAHVVLEEAPEAPAPPPALEGTSFPVLLSARSERALAAQIERLHRFVAERPDVCAADVARTLATARTHFERRAGFGARDREGLVAALGSRRLVEGEARPGGLALLFTGQGSQRARMGAALHARFPVFREALDEVLGALDRELPRPLGPVLFAESDPALDETGSTQPALFAVEVALFRLVSSWGIAPGWVAGHSVGEIAAAHVAGVLSLGDACALVAARGRLMQALPRGGAMAAIEAAAEEVEPLLVPGEVELAAVNGPRAVVVSGDEAAVARVAEAFTARGRRARRLRVSHAFHSPRMDAMLGDLGRVAEGLRFAPPRIPLVSTVTGRPAEDAELCAPAYWVRQARATVRFADAVRALAGAGVTTCLELGPEGALSALGSECVPGDRVQFVPSLRKGAGEAEALADALVRLHARGAVVDWDAVFAALGGGLVDLPTYAFERERHWVAPRRRRAADEGDHPLLGAMVPVAATGADVLTGRIALAEEGWLAGHVVDGAVILPGTAFVELAFEAARRVGLPRVEELTLEAPLPLDGSGAVEVQVAVAAADAAGRRALTLHARTPGAAWRQHASGTLGPDVRREARAAAPWPPVGSEPVALDGLYPRLAALGLDYGEAFRRVTAAWRRGGELFVEVALAEGRSPYGLHPALLDAALHVLLGESPAGGLVLPFSWAGATLHARGATALRVRIARVDGRVALEVEDGRGEPVASVAALVTRPVATTRVTHLHRLVWSTRPFAVERAAPRVEGAWALVGAELPGLAGALGLADGSLRRVATVEGLRAALDGGATPPAVIAFHDGDDDPRAAARRTLAFLQGVLADRRLDGARVALLTRAALVVTEGDTEVAVAQAGAAGFSRAARAENPARTIVHVDLDADPRSLAALPAALAAGEAQVALRAGTAHVARLGRRPAAAAGGRGFATEGTVLVTGGTGALGALVARHLVGRHGVRDLVLASRHGEGAPGAAALGAELGQAGARVSIVACDVGDRAEVARLVAGAPRLSGVVHAAGVLDDGLVADLDAARVDRVFAPKVLGALHLDALTRDRRLDYFVLFSSVAAHLGPPGQGSYAAASAALDALAHRRRGEGLPALAVDFGPWAEAGMAARLGATDAARLRRLGLGSLSPRDALAGLDAALASGEPQLTVAALVDAPAERRAPRGGFDEVVALPPEERARALGAWVRAEAARVLGLASPAEVPWEQPLRELGMDSLGAVELRNAVAARLGRALPVSLVFDHPHAAALARWLAAEIAPPETGADRVDEMSEGELDALLASLEGTP